MGVRIDRPGVRWWDYQTVGAGIGLITAAGGIKTGAQGTLIKRKEYLADASFLVALQGEPALIEEIANALQMPKWTIYLGRKSCPPTVPVFTQPCKAENASWANPMYVEGGIKAALQSVPWYPRYGYEAPASSPVDLPCLIEWRKSSGNDIAPVDAEVWYDTPFSFDPPVHHPRLVMRDFVAVIVGEALQQRTPPPPRLRANYHNAEWKGEALVDAIDSETGVVTQQPKGARPRRLLKDFGLCVFCKCPATTVQHITYRRAGGNEGLEDLCSLCRLCHDAVTMIEYGLGMGLDRIDPTKVRWREDILRTREEILRFRSEEGRRRALRGAPEKVRLEVLEAEDL